jgi:hypothetical protein
MPDALDPKTVQHRVPKVRQPPLFLSPTHEPALTHDRHTVAEAPGLLLCDSKRLHKVDGRSEFHDIVDRQRQEAKQIRLPHHHPPENARDGFAVGYGFVRLLTHAAQVAILLLGHLVPELWVVEEQIPNGMHFIFFRLKKEH